jgi:hypothetical protein
VTHELIRGIEPTGVKCVPAIREYVGCKQREDGRCRWSRFATCPQAALSCVSEGLMSASSWFGAAHPCWGRCSSHTLASPAEFEAPSTKL